MHPSYKLTLADGFSLQIKAEDAEAAPAVDLLASAMMLKIGEAEYKLCVSTATAEEGFSVKRMNADCRLFPPVDKNSLGINTLQIGLVIANMIQKRGGLLVHGGLIEFLGQGIILAAPHDTGKTTAIGRLRAPWKPLSDDATLIVRGSGNRYYGHPWPTWSCFMGNASGGYWRTEAGVPLASLVFLSQSPQDRMEDLNASQAAAMLIESTEQANRLLLIERTLSSIHQNHIEQFENVCAITGCLSAHRLYLSLTGSYWKLLEESLERSVLRTSYLPVEDTRNGIIYPSQVGVVISGDSMIPTLKGPGYVEVRPYRDQKPRRGDIICFRSPVTGEMIVHRVMRIRLDGLVTGGDHNAKNDAGCVPLSEVEGKVIRVRDVKGTRSVRGGNGGMMDYVFARILRGFRIAVGRVRRVFFPAFSTTGCLSRFLPGDGGLKCVFFGHPAQGQLKIMSQGVSVGFFEWGIWRIAYPWRLWIDPVKLQIAVEWVDLLKERWAEKSAREIAGVQ